MPVPIDLDSNIRLWHTHTAGSAVHLGAAGLRHVMPLDSAIQLAQHRRLRLVGAAIGVAVGPGVLRDRVGALRRRRVCGAGPVACRDARPQSVCSVGMFIVDSSGKQLLLTDA